MNLMGMFGDGMALGCCIFMSAVYLNLRPVLKDGFPSGLVSLFMVSLSAAIFFVISLFMYTFDADPETGVFGWLHPDNFVFCFFAVGFINGVGNIGSYFTLKYLDPVTLGTIFLLMPVLSGLLAYLIGVDAAPGLMHWIGGIVMLVGCGLIIRSDED